MDLSQFSFLMNEKDRLEKLVDVARKSGKSDKEIKLLLGIALDEMKKKVKVYE